MLDDDLYESEKSTGERFLSEIGAESSDLGAVARVSPWTIMLDIEDRGTQYGEGLYLRLRACYKSEDRFRFKINRDCSGWQGPALQTRQGPGGAGCGGWVP
jgi:hypothetical protein